MTGPDVRAPSPTRVVRFPPSNPFAVVALVAGVVAIVLGIVPLFIGLVLSSVPAVLAIAFGVAGLVRGVRVDHRVAIAVVGLVLGGLTVVLWFHGYGTWW